MNDLSKLIAIGDSFGASVIESFALNSVSLNELGQVAIRVKLQNGHQLILRADPKDSN